MLHSEVIGQRLNLTSDSFRAFRFAKRCLGGRGGGPFLMVFASIFGRSSRPLPQSLRYAPAPIVKRTDSHVAPLLGMTEILCHCEEAHRADAAIRIPVPKGSLV